MNDQLTDITSQPAIAVAVGMGSTKRWRDNGTDDG